MLVFRLIFLVIGFAMLVKGADWFVDSASGLARRLGVPQMVIALTVVAMGTSAPELAVSLSAALRGDLELSMGSVVGSNILNILIILGVCSMAADLDVASSTIRAEIPFLVLVTAVLQIQGGGVGRGNSVALLLLFAVYIGYVVWMAKKGRAAVTVESPGDQPLGRYALMTALGLGMIVLGSSIVVDAASDVARRFGLSERFIGLTIVALGTSLPELVTSLNAALKGNADIALGNIVGSNIFNILFILGLSGLVVPASFADLYVADTLVAVAATAVLAGFCMRKGKLVTWHGTVMLVGYGVYLGWLLMR